MSPKINIFLLFAASALSASTAINNPGFEDVISVNGKELIDKWTCDTGKTGKNYAGTDGEIKYEGKKSLKLKSEDQNGYIRVSSSSIPLPENFSGSVRLSVMAKSSEMSKESNASVVLEGDSPEKSQLQWTTLVNCNGEFEWKEFKGVTQIKPGVKSLRVSLRLAGNGTIWFDKVDLELLSNSDSKLAECNKKNSSISLSDTLGLPENWESKFFEGLESTALFSTKSVNGRNAAEVLWQGGSSNVGIQPEKPVPVTSGTVYEFSADIMSGGEGLGQLQVDFLDAKGKCLVQEKSDELGSMADWKKLSLCFEVPQNSMSMNVYCLNKGQGTVWFSKISLKESRREYLAKVFPVKFACEPAEGNAIWNNGEAVFNTFMGSPCSLTFDFWGDKSKLKSPVFIIDLPEEVSIAECFYTHASIEKQKLTALQEPVVRNGRKYMRYSFVNPECFKMIAPQPAWCRSLTVLFDPSGKSDTVNKKFKAFVFIQNGEERSSEKTFTINFLPPMPKSANPKNFSGMIWNNQDLGVSDNKLFESILLHFEEANLTGRSFNNWGRGQLREQDEICRAHGWQLYFTAGGSVFEKIEKDEDKALLYNGKKTEHLCPSFLLSPETYLTQKELFKSYTEKLNLKDADIVVLDYEPWQASDWCFCDKCVKRFAEFAGLTVLPSVESIRTEHVEAWTKFRIKDSAEIIERSTRIAKENNPSRKVIDYDYPYYFNKKDFEKRFREIAKDTRISDRFIDGHMNSFYHHTGKEAFDLMSTNVEVLKKPVFILPMITRYTDPRQKAYTNLKETLSPEQFEITVLAGAASGAKGLSIWDGTKIDGKYFLAIDHAMELIAKFEDFYTDGARHDSSAIPEGENIAELGVRVHKLKKQTLITIFNFANLKESKFVIKAKVPDGKYQVFDAVSGTALLSPDAKNLWTSDQLTSVGLSDSLCANKVKFIMLKSMD